MMFQPSGKYDFYSVRIGTVFCPEFRSNPLRIPLSIRAEYSAYFGQNYCAIPRLILTEERRIRTGSCVEFALVPV